MKIKETIPNINPSVFLEDYCKTHNIEDIDSFINPSILNVEPISNYDNMQEGYELILKNINNNICILVDTDADGYTSASIIYNYIKDINIDAKISFVIHENKEHGLDDEVALNKILELNPNLLICPDSASGDYEQHKRLKKINIDTLCLDHHPVDKYSEYAVVINNQLSKSVSNKDFCGAGVVYKFVKYCDSKFNTNHADKYIDLVALGNIADIMDTRQIETRYYIMEGLKNISNKFFLDMVKTYCKKTENITMTDISFMISNRINAIIRSGTYEDKIHLFYAFIEPDKKVLWQKGVRSKEQEYTMSEKCVLLSEKLKKQQADEVNEILSSGSELTNELPFTMIKTFEKSNYNGLIAMRTCSDTKKPTLVGNNGSGSYRALSSHDNMKELLLTYPNMEYVEGHNYAGGYKVKDGYWDNFIEWIKTHSVDYAEYVVKSYKYDEIPDSLFQDCYQNQHLWGAGIKSPLFYIKPFQLNSSQIMMMGNNTTLKIPLGNLSAIKFFCSKKIREDFYVGEYTDIEVELIVELSVNYWGDGKYNQFLIKDYSVKKTAPKISWDDLI